MVGDHSDAASDLSGLVSRLQDKAGLLYTRAGWDF